MEAPRFTRGAAGRWIAPAALVLTLLGMPAGASAATFQVNSGSDHGDGPCDPTATGDCTLREAIGAANASAGADTITFAIPKEFGNKPWVTVNGQPFSPMTITEQVTIDGTTEPVNAGFPSGQTPPRVEVQNSGFVVAATAANTVIQDLAVTGVTGSAFDLRGGNATVRLCFIGLPPSVGASDYTPSATPTTGAGVHVASNGNTISANVVSGNKGDGIDIESGDSNSVLGNFVGPDGGGGTALGNGANGVHVRAGANNVIGGTTTANQNVISGNGTSEVAGSGAGVAIDAAATGTVLRNNLIGVRFGAGGLANRAMPNEGNGVLVAGTGTTVGGTTTGAGNLISGNSAAGLALSGSGTQVQGNFIGTDQSGEVAVPNASGISVAGNSNVIGGSTTAARNVISGNAGNGVTIGIGAAAVSGTVVKGNRVGTDDDGLEPLANGADGIALHSATSTAIGGTAAGEANTISANRGRGILLDGTTALPAQSNTIQGNRIGTDLNGATALGNKSDGVNIGSGAPGNTIGGTGAGEPNTIAFNNGAGVRMPTTTGGNSNSAVSIRGNSIYSNTGLGIDLDATGVMANDFLDNDDGPNHKQNSPDLSRATSGGGTTTVNGLLFSKIGETYSIDYYSDTSCDASGHGEGRTFLGSKSITTLQDGTQFVDETLPTEVPPGSGVSATATDANGNTSEFGACATVTGTPAVSVGDAHIAEDYSLDDHSIFVPVTLDHASARTVTVDVALQDGTASSGSDYTPSTQHMTFSPGNTQQFIRMQVVDDALDEADETVSVAASNPANATLGHAPGTVTIDDNDAPPSLSIADTSAAEGTGGTAQMSFTVTLSAPSGRPVTVDAVTADGTAKAPGDYDATRSTLTFAPGATTRTLTVPIAPDSADEPDETLTAALEFEQFAGVTRRQATGTITDDDGPAASVGDVTVNEAAGTASVPVTLGHASSHSVAVDYATQPGSATAGADFTATSGTLTFAPGDPLAKNVTVPIANDSLDEPDEAFTLALSNPSQGTIGDGTGAVTITDDDAPPSLSIADTSVAEGTGTASHMTFTVSLSAPSGRAVTVDAVTADGTATAPGDYDATRSTLTFAPGATTRTFTVPIASDSADEPDETLTAGLESEQFAGITRRQATGTITDDDEPEKKPDPEVITVPGPTVVVPGPTEPRDTKAPGLTFGKLAATIKRKDFLAKGLSFDLTPDEAASFEVALVGKAKNVTLARAGDTTLADAELPLAAGTRAVKLKLSSKLKRAFTKKAVKLELRVTAFDAAGNRTRVVKTVTIR